MTARVAESERTLLTIVRALVGQASPEAAALLLRRACALDQVRPTAMRLLKETLSRGVVLELARRGGWRKMRHLRDGAPVTGRLWERHAAPSLRFSSASFELCRWLTVAPLGTVRCPPLTANPQTAADEFVWLLASELLVEAGLVPVLSQTTSLRDGVLVRLALFDRIGPTPQPPPPSKGPPGKGVGGWGLSIILEAIQADLARRWVAAERTRRKLTRRESVESYAVAVDAVLDPFLRDCEAAGRPDLADFLLEACSQLLGRTSGPASWVGAPDHAASLRDRLEARKASGVLLRHLGTLRRWAETARHTAFFDDGYAAAQALASRWELVGDAGFAKAGDILKSLDAMDFESRFGVEMQTA